MYSFSYLEPVCCSMSSSNCCFLTSIQISQKCECDHSPRARHPGFQSQVGLESITTNKASGGDGIPVGLFQILKDDAVKVTHSICQQIWNTQQWPQDWRSSVLIPIPKKGNAK